MPGTALRQETRPATDAQPRLPGVYFPLRLRCGAVSDLLASPELEAGLVRALARAFAHARAAVPATASGRVVLQPPQVARGELTAEEAGLLVPRIARAIEQAARTSGLMPAATSSKPAPAHAHQTSAHAEDAARQTSAAISEPFDPRRFDPATATYDVPSYQGGRAHLRARTTVDPFRILYPLFDASLAELADLMRYLRGVPDPDYGRMQQMTTIQGAHDDIDREARATHVIASVLLGRMREEDVPDGIRPYARELVDRYRSSSPVFPAPGRVRIREIQLQRGLALQALVRVAVVELDHRAASAGGAYVRQAMMDVGNFYLELLTVKQEQAFERLAFLQSFYRDPRRIVAYAVLRFARSQLDMLWTNLRRLSISSGDSAGILGDIGRTNPIPPGVAVGPRQRLTVAAANRALLLNGELGRYGDLPSLPRSGAEVPDGAVAGQVAAWITQLHVDVALLDLWQPFDTMRTLILQYPQIGTTLNPFVSDQDQDRNVWLRQMTHLENEFTAEAGRFPHPGFAQRAAAWQRQVQHLLDRINSAVRSARITAAVVEMVPLLFVGGAVADGVGAWVAELTNGSRWLVAIAEGVTLTGLNMLGAPSGNPRRAGSPGGWAGQLALNILLARLGPVIGAFAEKSAASMPSARTALLVFVSVHGAKLAGFAALQAATQAVMARVSGQKGESGFTELLTINLLLNTLGLALGAAARQAPPAAEALTRTTLPSQPGPLPSAAELAGRLQVSEQVAQQVLDLAGRVAEYNSNLEAAKAAARAGRLTAGDFEAWRRRSLELLDDLAVRLPDLADAVDIGISRAGVTEFLSGLRARIQAASFAGGVRLLPEFVPGLHKAGEGIGWTYDPQHPPATAQMAALQGSFTDQGDSVRQLPGGGWEADDANGRPVFLALPAAPEVAGLLPPAPAEVARGPLARAGLANVEAQTALPRLEPELAAATVRSGRGTVNTLLRELAGLDRSNGAVWQGLSNYLGAEGDPALLARVLSFREEPTYAARHATRVLAQMSMWDRAAIEGLQALYQVRPRTTSDELANLLTTFPPDQVEGIMQAVGELADRSQGLGKVIGPLFRDPSLSNRAQERGAQGTLTAAVQLARQFPHARLDFEVEVADAAGTVIRRQDINLLEPSTGETLLSYEIKEVAAGSLANRRVRHELAVDMVVESAGRDPAGNRRPPFSTFRWRIRAADFARQAAANLGLSDVNDPRVAVEMRRLVHDELAPAFSDPVLRTVSPATLRAYRAAFDRGVPFVNFF